VAAAEVEDGEGNRSSPQRCKVRKEKIYYR